jgi:hypothetical protein
MEAAPVRFCESASGRVARVDRDGIPARVDLLDDPEPMTSRQA